MASTNDFQYAKQSWEVINIFTSILFFLELILYDNSKHFPSNHMYISLLS